MQGVNKLTMKIEIDISDNAVHLLDAWIEHCAVETTNGRPLLTWRPGQKPSRSDAVRVLAVRALHQSMKGILDALDGRSP